MNLRKAIALALLGAGLGFGYSTTTYALNKFDYRRAIEAARQLGFPSEDSSQATFAEGARWQSEQP